MGMVEIGSGLLCIPDQEAVSGGLIYRALVVIVVGW